MKKEVRTTQAYRKHFCLPSIKFFPSLITIALLFLGIPS